MISLTRDFKFSENVFRSCGNPQSVTYTRDEAGCRKDRRATLVAAAAMGATGEISRQIEHYFTIVAQRKRACIWAKYNTNIQFVGEHTMTSQHQDETIYSPSFTFGPNTLNPFSSCAGCKTWRITAVEATLSQERPLDILSARSRGTTQGIGNNYVVLNCDD